MSYFLGNLANGEGGWTSTEGDVHTAPDVTIMGQRSSTVGTGGAASAPTAPTSTAPASTAPGGPFRPSPFGTGGSGVVIQQPRTGTGTSNAGNPAGGSAIAGKYIGTTVGQRYTPSSMPTTAGKTTGTGGKAGGLGGKVAGTSGGKLTAGAQIQPTEPAPETLPEAPAPDVWPTAPEAPAGGEAGASTFSQYKWWFIGGSVALVAAGVGAYFLLRKKPGAVATSEW